MATPPTFVAEYESAWSPGASSRSVSPTVAAGDILVVVAATEDGQYTQATPTGGGLTYTLRQSVQVANYSAVRIWTAPSVSSQSFTLSVGVSPGSPFNGINVLRFSGHNGVGGSGATNVASGTGSLSFTATGDNSALVCINADWNAGTGSRTWQTVNGITPTSGNGLEVTYAATSNYTVYAAYWNDSGANGSKTVGLSAPSGQKYAIAGVEILGIAAAGVEHVFPRRPARGLYMR